MGGGRVDYAPIGKNEADMPCRGTTICGEATSYPRSLDAEEDEEFRSPRADYRNGKCIRMDSFYVKKK